MKWMDKKTLNRIFSPMILSLLFVAAWFALIYVTYGVYYLTNDDIVMMKAFSGYNTGTPMPYDQFSSFTLGMMYKCLYTLIPAWNWYSYVSILVVIVSNAVIIWSIYKQRDLPENSFRYVDFLLIGTLTVAISLYGIRSISFTVNAAFSAIAGVMLLMNLSAEKSIKHLQYICAVIFMAVASMIRIDSFMAILPFAVLVLFYRAGNRIRTEGRENIRKVCIELVILLLPLMGVVAYNSVDTVLETKIFPSRVGADDYDYYRVLYMDHPHIPYEGNEDFYESIGWDREFYDVTGILMYLDPRFNTENLKKIAEASSSLRGESGALTERVLSSSDKFLDQTRGNKVRICMSIAVIFFLMTGLVMTVYKLLRKGGGWYDWLFLAGVQAVSMAEWVYIIDRFIDRSFYCATYPALFIGVWVFARHAVVLNHRKVLYIPVGLFAVAVMYIAAKQNLSRWYSGMAKQRASVMFDADEIFFSHSENLYICDASVINGTPLFLNMDFRGCGNMPFWGGTVAYSESFYEMIEKFGYDEFYSNNFFDENVYYITTDSDVRDSILMQYMKKTYGESVDAKAVDTTDSGVYVYKFCRM